MYLITTEVTQGPQSLLDTSIASSQVFRISIALGLTGQYSNFIFLWEFEVHFIADQNLNCYSSSTFRSDSVAFTSFAVVLSRRLIARPLLSGRPGVCFIKFQLHGCSKFVMEPWNAISYMLSQSICTGKHQFHWLDESSSCGYFSTCFLNWVYDQRQKLSFFWGHREKMQFDGSFTVFLREGCWSSTS